MHICFYLGSAIYNCNFAPIACVDVASDLQSGTFMPSLRGHGPGAGNLRMKLYGNVLKLCCTLVLYVGVFCFTNEFKLR